MTSADTPTRRVRHPGLHSSTPRKARCGKCGADADLIWHSALDHLLDPAHLTQHGELDALICGLRTFHVTENAVDRRTAISIARNPTVKVGHIQSLHKCGRVISRAHIELKTQALSGPPDLFTPDHDEPPF